VALEPSVKGAPADSKVFGRTADITSIPRKRFPYKDALGIVELHVLEP
jgi:hypothetical protein